MWGCRYSGDHNSLLVDETARTSFGAGRCVMSDIRGRDRVVVCVPGSAVGQGLVPPNELARASTWLAGDGKTFGCRTRRSAPQGQQSEFLGTLRTVREY